MLGTHAHRTELGQAEGPAVVADALLPVEHGPAILVVDAVPGHQGLEGGRQQIDHQIGLLDLGGEQLAVVHVELDRLSARMPADRPELGLDCHLAAPTPTATGIARGAVGKTVIRPPSGWRSSSRRTTSSQLFAWG